MFSNSQLSKIIPAQGLGRLLPSPWSNCDTPMWTQPTRPAAAAAAADGGRRVRRGENSTNHLHLERFAVPHLLPLLVRAPQSSVRKLVFLHPIVVGVGTHVTMVLPISAVPSTPCKD